jgi:hypothetical protein
MVVRGRVQNGVVVLEDGVRLPEGQEMAVLTPAETSAVLAKGGRRPHSLLDIAPISLGAALRPLTSDDDVLGEMLEDRR